MTIRTSVTLGRIANAILLPFAAGCGSAEPSPYDLDTRRQTVVTTSEFRELGPVAHISRKAPTVECCR